MVGGGPGREYFTLLLKSLLSPLTQFWDRRKSIKASEMILGGISMRPKMFSVTRTYDRPDRK